MPTAQVAPCICTSGTTQLRLIEAIARCEDTVHYMCIHTLQQPRWREISVRGALALADAVGRGDAEAAERQQAELLAHARDAFLVWCSDNG